MQRLFIHRINDETKQTIRATRSLKKKSVSNNILDELAKFQSRLTALQLQHAVIDITCEYMWGSLCVPLMTTCDRINASLLRRGNVRVEGER